MRRMRIEAGAGVVAVFFALAFTGLAQAPAKTEAKVLFDFENDADVAKWEAATADVSLSDEHATAGKKSLKVVLHKAEYPGLTSYRLPLTDWSGSKALKFDVFADEGLNLAVRIDDENSKDYASRFNLEQNELKKGANAVSLSLEDIGAKVDVKKVKMLILFAVNVDKDTTFYLDNVRLEN